MGSGKVGKVLVTVGVANINSDRFIYEKALVDTGADKTVIPKRVADALGIKPYKKTLIRTGNGPVPVGDAGMKIMLNGEIAYANIWISEKINKVLIGVITLEQLGLRVNPVKGILEKKEQVLYAVTC